MAFAAGNQCSVLVATQDLSSYFNDAETAQQVTALDATCFKQNSKVVLPGLGDGKLMLKGLWDPALDPTLVGQIASSGEVVTVGPAGLTAGTGVAYLLKSRLVTYKESTPIGGICAVQVDCQADGGILSGYSLHDLVAETGTANGTANDLGAVSTLTGAVAHLHVSAFSGFTNVIFTIADSADNVSFSTIGTFTTVTGITSERITITGTIRRYVRVTWTKTGTGSVTFATAFARS